MLGELVFKYLPYWPIFIVFLILSLLGAWFYLRITPPKYEISAAIMIKDEKKAKARWQELREKISHPNMFNSIAVSGSVLIHAYNKFRIVVLD